MNTSGGSQNRRSQQIQAGLPVNLEQLEQTETEPAWERLVCLTLRLAVGCCLLPVILLAALLTGFAQLMSFTVCGLDFIGLHVRWLTSSPLETSTIQRPATTFPKVRYAVGGRAVAWCPMPSLRQEAHILN